MRIPRKPGNGPAAMEEREDGGWHVTGVAEMDGIEVDRGSVRVISSAQAGLFPCA